MILFGDYHTHTPYSHGKGTILQNAQIAAAKGLKEIAITDHGPAHLLCGMNKKKLDIMRKECQEAERQTGVKVLLGVEANFVSRKGDIDISPEEYEKFDIILCGYHKSGCSRKGFFSFFLKNLIVCIHTKRCIQRNTEILKRAMDKNKIHVLVHLNVGLKVDVCEVARHAKKCGTFVELNGRRLVFTDAEIRQMVSDGVMFIVNSDAHKACNVGECNQALALITRLHIPLEQVVNIDKIPHFFPLTKKTAYAEST